MTNKQHIEQEIKELRSRYAHVLDGSLATIEINAPRAMLQLSATTQLRALHWVLGTPFTHKFKGRPNS